MRLSCGLFVCAIILLARPASYATSHKPASREKSQQELLALENHWLQVESDPDAREAILAPDFLHVVPAELSPKTNSSTSCARTQRLNKARRGTSRICT